MAKEGKENIKNVNKEKDYFEMYNQIFAYFQKMEEGEGKQYVEEELKKIRETLSEILYYQRFLKKIENGEYQEPLSIEEKTYYISNLFRNIINGEVFSYRGRLTKLYNKIFNK